MLADTDKTEDVIAYLRYLWDNPAIRQERHLQLREAHTVHLNENAPDTASWAVARIAQHLSENTLPAIILDVGCGNGYYLDAIVPNFVRLGVGVEKSTLALHTAAAQTKANSAQIQLLQANALALPFATASFNAVMANRMLNQTGNIALALAEMYRVMLPTGLLFVVTAETGETSLLKAIHEAVLQDLAFPARLYQHTTLPDQRLGYDNAAEWFSQAGFSISKVEMYERRLNFEQVEAALEHYATGLMFQKSSGFNEDEITPERWAKLYLRVKAALVAQWEPTKQLLLIEGAALIIARKT